MSYTSPDDISESEMEVIRANFLRGADELDQGVALMRTHLEEGGCQGPWCQSPEYGRWEDKFHEFQLHILLQQATRRLALLEAQIEHHIGPAPEADAS